MIVEDSAAYGLGRIVGSLVGILIPVAFFLKATQRLSDPEHSRRCALSLAFVMSGWALSSAGYALSLMSPGFGCILTVAFIIAIVLILVGIVLSVLGLAEDPPRVGKPLEGRGQAVGALVVGGLLLILGAGGFVAGAFSARQVPKDWKMAQLPPGTTISNEPKNFTFTVPEKDWVQVIPGKLNPVADLAFVDTQRKVFFILISVPLSRGVSVTNEKLLEVAKGDLRKIDAAARFGEVQPELAGTVAGFAFTGDARVGKENLTYRQWVHAGRTHLYQLAFWGPEKSKVQVVAAAGQLLRTFGILQP